MIATATLAVWNDIDAGREAAFESWYEGEHVPERLSVPGFRDAWRGIAVDGEPKYCALYRLDSLAVLRQPYYLERLANPTPRTTAIMPHFRRMNRSACRVVAADGAGAGAAKLTWPLAAPTGDGVDPAAAALGRLRAAVPDVLRAELWAAEPSLSVIRTAEQGMRPEPDRCADRVLVLDADAPDALDRARGALLGLAAAGGWMKRLGTAGVYRRLSYRASAAGDRAAAQ
jgi:hypothetical protein